MSTKLTVKQFEEANHLTGLEASQFLKVLESSGIIKVAGKTRINHLGRYAIVYDVDPEIFKNLKLECPVDGIDTEIIKD